MKKRIKKKLDYNNLTDDEYEKELKKFLISALRRVSLYWKPRNEAFKNARVARGLYKCASCNKTFSRKEVVADHKNPAVAIKGFETWAEYVKRMLPKAEGFQVLCKLDHDRKSREENLLRKIKRNVLKNKAKCK